MKAVEKEKTTITFAELGTRCIFIRLLGSMGNVSLAYEISDLDYVLRRNPGA